MGLFEPHGGSGGPVRRDALIAAAAPIIVVHTLAHAIAALAAAAKANRSIILASAPDAGIYAGAGWLVALLAAAHDAVPTAPFTALLDSGDDAGAAQAAIRAGIAGVIFTGRADIAERLSDIAGARGICLLTERPTPTLDLGGEIFASGETLRRRCTDALASSAAFCYKG